MGQTANTLVKVLLPRGLLVSIRIRQAISLAFYRDFQANFIPVHSRLHNLSIPLRSYHTPSSGILARYNVRRCGDQVYLRLDHHRRHTNDDVLSLRSFLFLWPPALQNLRPHDNQRDCVGNVCALCNRD